MAIGIFAFCLVAIFVLFLVAMDSSRESLRDSALVSIVDTLDTHVRSANPATLTTSLGEFFFDLTGNLIVDSTTGNPITTATALTAAGKSNDAYFQVNFTRAPDASVAGTLLLNQGSLVALWSVSIRYPYPANTDSRSILLGRPAS